MVVTISKILFNQKNSIFSVLKRAKLNLKNTFLWSSD